MSLEQERVGHKNHTYYFDNIDILRGFAAISVMVYHCIAHFNWTTFPTSWPLCWFHYGWMGVDIFFVISGFVITLSAFNKLDKNDPQPFFISFMKRRLLRIVPLHYLTMLVFVVFVTPALLFEDFRNNLITHMLFIHNLFLKYQGSINGSNWSLGAEMQFYVVIAITARWLSKIEWWKILVIVLTISFIWRCGVVYFISLDQDMGTYKMFVAATQLPGMLDEFGVGILLARLIKTDIGQNLISGRKNYVVIFFLSSCALIFVTLQIYLRHGSYWDYPLIVIFFRTLLAVTVGIILLFLCSLKIRPIIRKVLLPFYYLGTISYGIYLWHLPVIMSVKRIEWLPKETAFFTVVIITLVFASGSWYFYERHFLRRR